MAKNVFGQVMDGFADVVPDERHEDTKRIDWVQKHGVGIQIPRSSCLWRCAIRGEYGVFEWSKYKSAENISLRRAIDATIKIYEER